MEQIKELTKQLISNSFKELMQKYPFEKITIKMITDAAHIIRPTFYNHFHDKYELVEWIFEDEIINKIRDDIKSGGLKSVKIMTSALAEDMDYYKKLFEAYANTWKCVNTEEYEYLCLTQDTHPLNYLRTNAVLQQFDEFLDAYDIKEGDNMYLAPEDRVLVW